MRKLFMSICKNLNVRVRGVLIQNLNKMEKI